LNVSVIIPVYNAEKYIEKAVLSALVQDEVKEIVLVEDASPDNALKICQDLAQKYDIIKLYTHPNNENRGAGASRNLGINKATQEYLAFLDADDFYLPNRFKKDKEVFEKYSQADGVYSAIGVHFYSEEAKQQFCSAFNCTPQEIDHYLTTVSTAVAPQDLFKVLIGLNKSAFGYFSLDGFTIKRKTLGKIYPHFNQELRLHQDTEFLYRVAYYAKLYPSNIKEAVAKRGVHESNRITQSDAKKKIANRIKLYQVFLNWAQKEKLELDIQDKFRFSLLRFKFQRVHGIKKHLLFAKSSIIERRFFSSSFGEEMHYNMFDNKAIQQLYSKVYFILHNKKK
jgi:glycosyltransferase involved in cell wall biosynthesis